MNNKNIEMSQKKKKNHLGKHWVPAGRKQIITAVKDGVVFIAVHTLKDITSLDVSEKLPQICFPSLIWT